MAGGGDETAVMGRSDPSSFDASSEEAPEEGSQESLEQADADEEEKPLEPDAAGGATAAATTEEEETPADDPKQQPSEPATPDPALTNARCGGQPASMIPFTSTASTRHRRLLDQHNSDNAGDASSSASWAGADSNRTASFSVDAADTAIDLAEVYTRHEQQHRRQRLQPPGQPQPGVGTSRRRNLLHRTIGFTMGKAVGGPVHVNSPPTHT